MSKEKPFRELQFSSAQLVIVFLAILVLGVFIFLLGISVGKKQTQLAAGTGPGPGLKTETVAPRTPMTEETAATAKTGLEKPSLPANAAPEGTAGAKPESAKPEAVKGTSAPADKTPNAKTAVKPADAAPADKPAGKPADSKPETAPAAKAKPGDAAPAAEAKTTAVKPPIDDKSAPRGRYYVQVGAVTDKPAAKTFAEKVEQLGFQAAVLDPLPTDRKMIFRVRIGPYASKAEADESQGKIAAALKKKKTDFFIVRD